MDTYQKLQEKIRDKHILKEKIISKLYKKNIKLFEK